MCTVPCYMEVYFCTLLTRRAQMESSGKLTPTLIWLSLPPVSSCITLLNLIRLVWFGLVWQCPLWSFPHVIPWCGETCWYIGAAGSWSGPNQDPREIPDIPRQLRRCGGNQSVVRRAGKVKLSLIGEPKWGSWRCCDLIQSFRHFFPWCRRKFVTFSVIYSREAQNSFTSN